MKLVDEMPDSVPDNYVAQDADARKGILRTVIIENVDRNPSVLFLPCEKVSISIANI